MRTLRQDCVSIQAFLRLLNLAPGPRAVGHLDLPAGDKELPEMANPITECDRVRTYAAPDPPLGALVAVGWLAVEGAPDGTFCTVDPSGAGRYHPASGSGGSGCRPARQPEAGWPGRGRACGRR